MVKNADFEFAFGIYWNQVARLLAVKIVLKLTNKGLVSCQLIYNLFLIWLTDGSRVKVKKNCEDKNVYPLLLKKYMDKKESINQSIIQLIDQWKTIHII